MGFQAGNRSDIQKRGARVRKISWSAHIPFITQVGFQTKPKVPQKRFVNTTSTKDKTKRNLKKSKTDSKESELWWLYCSFLYKMNPYSYIWLSDKEKERNGFLKTKDQ